MEHENKIIKIRDNGTLYFDIADFLTLPSVKSQIAKFMDSSIYKNLQSKKVEASESKDK